MPEYLGNEGNKLLKLIEEPPPDTLFILVAENESLILPTILSRTQLVKIPMPETADIEKALVGRAGIPAEQARQIAVICEGNYHEALQLTRHAEDDWQGMLREWLNAILKTGPAAQVKWIDEIGKSGRERQKQFLRYFNHLLEQAIRLRYIDAAQLHWLERKLEEVHSSFQTRDGSTARTRNADRYVVILSHHGYDTLSNPRAERRADALLDLLLRFRNVVLWLNGHIHANRITPRSDQGRGFWEVTTSSLVDWPCQARLVELFYASKGLLGIACTMLDHEGSTRGPDEGPPDLAGLHRELAANVPSNGFDSWRPGTPTDRNTILLLPAPF